MRHALGFTFQPLLVGKGQAMCAGPQQSQFGFPKASHPHIMWPIMTDDSSATQAWLPEYWMAMVPWLIHVTHLPAERLGLF